MSKNYNLEYYPEEKILNPPKHAQDEINQIIDLIKKGKHKIVDFGSGGGRLTIPLLQEGYTVTAVDTDKRSREQLLKTAIRIKGNSKLIISKQFQKEDKYDYILGADILHHVEIKKYFRIFGKHLKKEGKLIFSEPNPWNISWWVFILLFLDWKQEKGIIQTNYFNLIKELKSSGFKNIKIKGLFLLPPMLFNEVKFLRRLNILLSNLPILKLFAFRYIITASK